MEHAQGREGGERGAHAEALTIAIGGTVTKAALMEILSPERDKGSLAEDCSMPPIPLRDAVALIVQEGCTEEEALEVIDDEVSSGRLNLNESFELTLPVDAVA